MIHFNIHSKRFLKVKEESRTSMGFYKLISFFLLFALVQVLSPVSFGQSVRILPLGNSITQGFGSSTVPNRISYRYQLYNDLNINGYQFDYVGHKTAGYDVFDDPQHCGILGNRDQYLVTLLDRGFDVLGGEQITDDGRPYMDKYPSDIVLIHIGTNDQLNGEGTSPASVSEILDEIDEWEATNGVSVLVFVAEIINTNPKNDSITRYNNRVADMVADRADPWILMVDMEDGAGIDYGTEIEIDGIHPKQSAFDKIGVKWFEAIHAYYSAAPAAPSDFSLEVELSNAITLSWTDNASNETGFEIRRSLAPAGPYSLITTVAADEETFEDSGLAGSTEYFYRINAINDDGSSMFLMDSANTHIGPPAVPTDLDATEISPYYVSLSWSDNSSSELAFEIQRAEAPGTDYMTIHTTLADVTSHVDGTVTPGLSYYYRIRSTNSFGESDYSNVLTAAVPAIPTIEGTLGFTDVFGSVSTSDRRRAMPFTLSENGYIQSISMYHNGGSDGSGLILGVYEDDNGGPADLIGITQEVAINSDAGWQTVNLDVPATVMAGQTVWLAWVFESNPGIRYRAGNPGRVSASETWDGGMPETFGIYAQSGSQYSIYCSYLTSGDGSPPPAPSDLEVSAVAPFEISLSWSDNSNNEIGFEIQRSDNGGTDYSTIETTAGNVTRFADVTVVPESTYYYRVRSTNSFGESAYSGEVNATTPAEPVGDATLGITDVLSATSTSGTRRAMPFTTTEDGFIESISIYHSGRSDGSGLILGVYDDAGGLPSSLIGVTPETQINATEGWQTINLISPASVVASQTIWLAWVFESNPGIRYQAGNPGRVTSNVAWSGGMPESFGAAVQSGYQYSIYCSYSITGGGSPPAIPTNLAVSGITTSEVSLSWSDQSNNEVGFEIQRSEEQGTGYTTIHTTLSNVASYTDGTVTPENTYYYRIRSVNSYGESAYTDEVAATTPSASGSIILGNTEIFDLVTTYDNRRALPYTFSENGAIESITIYHDGGNDGSELILAVYGDDSGSPSSRLGKTPTATIHPTAGWQTLYLSSPVSVDAGQTIWLAWLFENNPGTRYKAGVPGRAQSPESWSGGMPESFGSSTKTNYIYSIYCTYSIPSGGVPPAEPSSLAVTSVTPYEVILNWTDNSNNESGFELQRSESEGSGYVTIETTVGNITSYVDAAVAPEQTYYYRLRAVNSYGESPYTQPVSATTLAEPIVDGTLGITEVLGSTSTSGIRRAMPYTMNVNGVIQSITIYHHGGSDGSGLIMGIYDNVDGAPSSLIGSTPEATISTSEGWQTVGLISPTPVVGGQTIWLAWVFENNPGIRYGYGTPGRVSSNETWSGGMPESFGISAQSSSQYSIYCSYLDPSGGSAPAAPTDLAALVESSSLVSLSWTDNSDNETSFEIQRSGIQGTGFTTIHITTENAIAYSDGAVSPGNDYYYRVRSTNAYGESVYSAEVGVTTPVGPSDGKILGYETVFGLSNAFNNRRAVPLTMQEDGSIETVTIYHEAGNDGSGLLMGIYNDDSGLPSAQIGKTLMTQVSYTAEWQTLSLITPVPVVAGQTIWLAWVFENNPGIRYQAGVPGRAQSPEEWSGGLPTLFGTSTTANWVYSVYCTYSTSVSGTSPSAPSDMEVSNATPYEVTLSWTDNSDNETGFELQRSSSEGTGFVTMETATANSTSVSDASVAPEQTYYYRLRAVNSFGESAFTSEVSATTPAVPVGDGTIGYDDVFGGISTSARRRAVPVTMTEDGVLQSVSIYHNGGTDGSGLILGIYDDVAGVPSALIGVTPEVPINAASDWQTVALTSPVPVVSGQVIWLAWVFENNPGIRYQSGTPGRASASEGWIGGMPLNWGAVSISGYVYSIYASYEAVPSLKGSFVSSEDQDGVDAELVRIYPNPAVNEVMVVWNQKYRKGLNLTLYNSIGGIVRIVQTDPDQKQVRIDVSDQQPGTYFILVTDPEASRVISRSKVAIIR